MRLAWLGALVPVALASAQGAGPDLLVAEIGSVVAVGELGGVSAYSLATTVCNVGDQDAVWIANTPEHPLFLFNAYRLENGRLEQLGQGWAHHTTVPLQSNACGSCQPAAGFQALGVGCSTSNSAFALSDPSQLGPRSEVDGFTGGFPFPFTAPPGTVTAISRRLQIERDDLDPLLHPGARYFVEAAIVAASDASAGNAGNNASFREVSVGPLVGGNFALLNVGSTQMGSSVLAAWPQLDPTAQVVNVRVPGEGELLAGASVTDNGNGTWHYEFTVANLDSHVGARSFRVPVHSSVTVTGLGFRDAPVHSGEPVSNADWVGQRTPNDVRWFTDEFAVDPLASALRFRTQANFWFDADAPPCAGQGVLGLFRPHPVTSLGVGLSIPMPPSVTASELIRNGTPPNPVALLPGQTTRPLLGSTWDPWVDHTSFQPGAVLDLLAIDPRGGAVDLPTAFGRLLVPINPPTRLLSTAPGSAFLVAVPARCDLMGVQVSAQAASLGPGGLLLTNSLDIVLGDL